MPDSDKNKKQIGKSNITKDIMKQNYTYPSPSDKDFLYKIYKKREFYYHKQADRPNLDNYNDIKEYRDNICSGSFSLSSHQSFLSNFINPDTPYKGVLVFHGTGTGKSCAAIAIAEKFKDMVQKYNTKIYVLVPSTVVRENWKNELLFCTAETYLKYQDKTVYMNSQQKNKAKKNALNEALQFYRFMGYKSFYRKVLGEKIIDRKTTNDNKTKVSYRKTDEGEFERDISVDRIYNLNNSVIIVDEAHHLTNNSYGDALSKIIKESSNLRIILLTATPMKNAATDIIELINFIRPYKDPILREKIFTNGKNYEMKFKEGGIEYLKNMARGYISYLRGADPVTFARSVEKGVVPKGLLFTKVTQCSMLPFQRSIYDTSILDMSDILDRKSSSVSNFVFPGLSEDRKTIVGYYGIEGINIIKNQLKSHNELLNKKISEQLSQFVGYDIEDSTDLIHLSESGNTISGNILSKKYLKYYSVKFYKAFKKVNRLVWGKKGSRTAFVYSNLVRVGIELFQEILMKNGYLEYQENEQDYSITHSTVCYFCGKTYAEHIKKDSKKKFMMERTKNVSESSTEYEKKKGEAPEHDFKPATFISVTGKSSDEGVEVIPEDKNRIMSTVFNDIDNIEGKNIKLVLGSQVMNEGISLKNVAEVHILDVYYNLGRVDQIIGRGIRYCSHYKLMSKQNMYPEVNIYKYCVTLGKNLSSEETLYKKAEKKYILIKKVERYLKEVAIDCPLNRNGNIFEEEVKKYNKCYEPGNEKKGEKMCPLLCDYMKCEFKCDDAILNNKYYDPTRKIYRKMTKHDLDVSTFTNSLARNEIENAKLKIKELYKTKYVYTLKNILLYVKNSYKDEKRDLFDNFFVYKALDELIPLNENDFNNFKDTVLDKYNRSGYIIYVNDYYIFQPFDQNENVPMYYRTTPNNIINKKLTLSNYIKNKFKDSKIIETDEKEENASKDNINIYDFESVMEYYDNRPEYDFVGIIDKESTRRKNKDTDDVKDIFKIREKRAKILEKKRGIGIPSLTGAVCSTSKSKEYLAKISKKLGISLKGDEIRINICNKIRDKMLELEKYSTKKNKLTYIMIPKNHSSLPFPYNLEDRVKYIIDDIKSNIKFNIDINVKDKKLKRGYLSYIIIIKKDKRLNEFSAYLKSINATYTDSNWVIKVE